MIHSVDEDTFNAVPFANSWTAAQVMVHVIKSDLAIAKALKLEGKIIEREPDERAEELKDLFLDFTLKFQSPDFILPPDDWCDKEEIIRDFSVSIEKLKVEGNEVNLAEAISHQSFGEITKLELLYFVLFHTQQHIHQLQNVITRLSYKKINSKL